MCFHSRFAFVPALIPVDFVPFFTMLLIPNYLLFSLSLCRCPFLFLGFQSFAVLFCPCLLLPCCFALVLWLLASHSAAVRSFSLVFSSLLFSFVPALASFLAFVPSLPIFCLFSSFFCHFSFCKPLTNSIFARTPSESQLKPLLVKTLSARTPSEPHLNMKQSSPYPLKS